MKRLLNWFYSEYEYFVYNLGYKAGVAAGRTTAFTQMNARLDKELEVSNNYFDQKGVS